MLKNMELSFFCLEFECNFFDLSLSLWSFCFLHDSNWNTKRQNQILSVKNCPKKSKKAFKIPKSNQFAKKSFQPSVNSSANWTEWRNVLSTSTLLQRKWRAYRSWSTLRTNSSIRIVSSNNTVDSELNQERLFPMNCVNLLGLCFSKRTSIGINSISLDKVPTPLSKTPYPMMRLAFFFGCFFPLWRSLIGYPLCEEHMNYIGYDAQNSPIVASLKLDTVYFLVF